MTEIKHTEHVMTVTRRTHEIVLTGRQIADMVLLMHGIPPGGRDVRVTFDVPCGGDYSGLTLDVSTQSPITITWTETEETKT